VLGRHPGGVTHDIADEQAHGSRSVRPRDDDLP
jgi:hypothetical protein